MFSTSCTACVTATTQTCRKSMTGEAYWSPLPEPVQQVSRPVRGRPALLQPGLIALRPLLQNLTRTWGGEHCARAPASAPRRARVRTAIDLGALPPTLCHQNSRLAVAAVATGGGAAGVGLAQRAVGRERQRALVRVARDLHAAALSDASMGPGLALPMSRRTLALPGSQGCIGTSHTAGPPGGTHPRIDSRPCMLSRPQLLHASTLWRPRCPQKALGLPQDSMIASDGLQLPYSQGRAGAPQGHPPCTAGTWSRACSSRCATWSRWP